eukprot:5689636-Alexandrium_andersonii.AAC.1
MRNDLGKAYASEHSQGRQILQSKLAMLPRALPGRSRPQLARRATWPYPQLGICRTRSPASH